MIQIQKLNERPLRESLLHSFEWQVFPSAVCLCLSHPDFLKTEKERGS